MTEIAGEASRRAAPPVAAPHSSGSIWALTLGSIGVVYGDIGTSPLYAFRVAVTAAAESGPVTRDTVLGVLSLILWALVIVVTIKYVLVLLRSDNNGEGGTLSLTALATRALGRRSFLLLLGIIGAAMFLGDSVITPAISVLSAVEGLELATPALRALRAAAHHRHPDRAVRRAAPRHRRVAAFFGPVMMVWFVTIAVAGAMHLRDDLAVFAAINPLYAMSFVATHGHIGLIALGAVFLAVTGGEALYADLGHFGRQPIQRAWLGLVSAGAADQLFRAGRAGAVASGGDRESVLPHGAGDAAAAARSCWRPPRP